MMRPSTPTYGDRSLNDYASRIRRDDENRLGLSAEFRRAPRMDELDAVAAFDTDEVPDGWPVDEPEVESGRARR
jgi:hypothetical protein